MEVIELENKEDLEETICKEIIDCLKIIHMIKPEIKAITITTDRENDDLNTNIKMYKKKEI